LIYNYLKFYPDDLEPFEHKVWQLAHRFLPSDRRFHALRHELDGFVECSRQLNQAALAIKINDTPEQRAAFDNIRQALHQSVEAIVEVEGKTQEKRPLESREEMALEGMG
jgi:hypothetical protein